MSDQSKRDPFLDSLTNTAEDDAIHETFAHLNPEYDVAAKKSNATVRFWLWVSGIVVVIGACVLFVIQAFHFLMNASPITPAPVIDTAATTASSVSANAATARAINTATSDPTHAETIAPIPLLAFTDKTPPRPQEPLPAQSLFEDPKIATLEKQLVQLSQLVDTQTEILATQKQAFSAQLLTLNEQIQALSKRSVQTKPMPGTQPASALRVSTGGKTRPNKASHRTASVLPFTLVSIDHWGDAIHAVVRYRGQLFDLSPGKTLAHWHLDDLNADGEGVYVINSQGQRALLTLND